MRFRRAAVLGGKRGRGAGGAQTHPFGHVPSVWIVMMILQNHHGGDHRHPHDDHYTGKVLTWERQAQPYFTFTSFSTLKVCDKCFISALNLIQASSEAAGKNSPRSALPASAPKCETKLWRRHLPMRGTESDVAGMISATSSMKTVSESRTVMPARPDRVINVSARGPHAPSLSLC